MLVAAAVVMTMIAFRNLRDPIGGATVARIQGLLVDGATPYNLGLLRPEIAMVASPQRTTAPSLLPGDAAPVIHNVAIESSSQNSAHMVRCRGGDSGVSIRIYGILPACETATTGRRRSRARPA